MLPGKLGLLSTWGPELCPEDLITHSRGLGSVPIVFGLVPTAAWDPPPKYIGICSGLLPAHTASCHPRTPDPSEWARLVLPDPYKELRGFQMRLWRIGPAFHINKVNEIIFVTGVSHKCAFQTSRFCSACVPVSWVSSTALSVTDRWAINRLGV